MWTFVLYPIWARSRSASADMFTNGQGIVFRKSGSCINCGADRPPGPLADALVGLPRTSNTGFLTRRAGPGGPAWTGGAAPQFMQIPSRAKTMRHQALGPPHRFRPCPTMARANIKRGLSWYFGDIFQ